jgi:hypothetical protein
MVPTLSMADRRAAVQRLRSVTAANPQDQSLSVRLQIGGFLGHWRKV